MFVDVEELVPGEVYEYEKEPVIFEGPGQDVRTVEVLGFRKVADGTGFHLPTPTVEKSKVDVSDFRKQFKRVPKIRQHQVLTRGNYLGSDPEFFLGMPDGLKTRFIPAFMVFPAKSAGTNLFWDGFQGEIRTSVQTCIEQQTLAVKHGIENALYVAQRQYLQLNPYESLKDQISMTVIPQSTMKIGKELELASNEQVALGCEGSSNAYGIKGTPVIDPRRLQYRFAGGHIHIGYSHALLTETMLVEAVKTIDMLAGIPSVILAEGWDDPMRRKFYGQAGEYRVPKHGLEYRTLSNFWFREPAVTQLMFGLVRGAFHWGLNGWRLLFAAQEEEVVRIIQTSDVSGARKWLKEHEELFKSFLEFAWISYPDVTFQVLTGEVAFPPSSNFSRWNFWQGSGYTEQWRQRMERLPVVAKVK